MVVPNRIENKILGSRFSVAAFVTTHNRRISLKNIIYVYMALPKPN